MSVNLENLAANAKLKTVSYHSILKKGNTKQCSNYCTILLFLCASKVMLKILPSQASTVCEPRTSRYTSCVEKKQKNQRSNCQHLLDHRKSKRISKIYLLFSIEYTKAFDCMNHNNLWKILKEMEYQNTLPGS